MKTYIKYLMAMVAFVILAITASAQSPTWAMHTSDRPGGNSFIGDVASALVLTNNIGITNLALSTYGTNWPGAVYTNKATGTRISTTTGTNGANSRLTRSVPLWSLRDGSPAFVLSTNGIGFVSAQNPGHGTIAVTVRAGAGAAAVLTLIFAPAWDGVNVDTSGAYDFTWGVTPTASATKTIATNAPLQKWIGAKAVVLKSISSADSATTKEAAIIALGLNGFGPP
tara:strand:+ start:61 stop:738 length:678 start_codon:yes stop_codon:yes gene_type:complete